MDQQTIYFNDISFRDIGRPSKVCLNGHILRTGIDNELPKDVIGVSDFVIYTTRKIKIEKDTRDIMLQLFQLEKQNEVNPSFENEFKIKVLETSLFRINTTPLVGFKICGRKLANGFPYIELIPF
ncbi:hypothetical protein QTN25_001114 [Entamoeba marina]